LNLSISLRGSGKPAISIARGRLGISIGRLFKEEFSILLEDIDGWAGGPLKYDLQRGPVLKRLPEVAALDSTGMGTKYNLSLFFRRPQRLPALKLKGVRTLAGSRKKAREGVDVDVVALQADDRSRAQLLLKRLGMTEFDGFEEGLAKIIGIVEDPLAAQRVSTKRRRELKGGASSIADVLAPLFPYTRAALPDVLGIRNGAASGNVVRIYVGGSGTLRRNLPLCPIPLFRTAGRKVVTSDPVDPGVGVAAGYG
jgi:hypothetical protein